MKRRKTTRWTAWALALLLMLSSLSGCTVANMKGGDAGSSTVPAESTTAAAVEADEGAMNDSISTTEAEKYAIGGTEAFYILPTGTDLSKAMLSFKLLDLINDKVTIYAYQVLYGLTDNEGRGGMPVSGTAQTVQSKVNDAALRGDTRLATIIMMYDTENKNYQVIKSWTDQVHVEEETDDNGTKRLMVTLKDSSSRLQTEDSLTDIFAHKIVQKNKDSLSSGYYLYAGGMGYFWHYDQDSGKCVFDATTDINAALVLAFNQAMSNSGKTAENTGISILEATADSSLDQYVSFYLTDKQSAESVDDTKDMSEEELAEKQSDSDSARYITCCFGISFNSETNDSNRFFSSNENLKKQLDEWNKLDGVTIDAANEESLLSQYSYENIVKANPDQGGTYTYNGEKNSFTVSLMYSTEQKYYALASPGAKMSDYQSFGTADLQNYKFMNEKQSEELLNNAPQNLTLAGRIQYKTADQSERAFLFPSDSSLLEITPMTQTMTRTYTVKTAVSGSGDSSDSDDSSEDSDAGSSDSAAENAGADQSDNTDNTDGGDSSNSGGGSRTEYTYETKTQTVDFVIGYYLRIRQRSFASWFTSESTPDGIIPAMGDGYLRYWYEGTDNTGKVTLTRTSGTLQENKIDQRHMDVTVKGTLRNAVFLLPSDLTNTGSSYLFLCTSEEVRVLKYASAVAYIQNKEKEPDAVFSGSNQRFNFRRNDVEGKDSSQEESIDVSDTLDEGLTSTGAESTDSGSGSTIGVDLKSELQDSMSVSSIDVLPGSYNTSEHLWVLSAGVTGGLVLTDLLRASDTDKAEDIASVQLSAMPCYAVYASAGGKAISVIGYDNNQYSYSSDDLYRAKLYHRSLFDKEMCYNMVMSLAKKDTSLYQSMLTDSSAFLTRLSNYWQLSNYKTDLSKAKEYLRYRKLVQNGKSEAVSLFCKLSGLKEDALSEDALTQLENCYDQNAVESLILTLRPELEDSTAADSQDSGIKISKDSTSQESSSSRTETETGSSTSDSGVSIKADTDKSYQEAQRRQRLRSRRCSELEIQESEWNADMSTLVEDLHPAASLEAYIRQRCLRYFASMGNLSYTDDMRLQLFKCSTWEDAEALLGTLRLNADEQLSLSTLKGKGTELSDEQKTQLAELEAKQKDAVNAAKLEAIKNLHDLDDSRKLLSEEYGNTWNDQWQKYWKETLTRIVEAAKTQS